MNKFNKLSGLIVFISVVFVSLASCDFFDDLFNDTTKDTTLSGKVILTGKTRPGNVLTANTNYLNATGSFSYQWKRTDADGESTNISGVNNKTYSIQETDVDFLISVTVTSSGYTGSVQSDALVIRVGEDLSGTYHDPDDILPSLIFTDSTVIIIYYDSIDPKEFHVESEGTYVADNDILTLYLENKSNNSSYTEIYDFYEFDVESGSLLLMQGDDILLYYKDDRAENAIIIDLEAMDEWEVFDQNTNVVDAGKNLTITVKGVYSKYTWYINGEEVSSTGNSYTFNKSAKGIYELVVVVKNDQGQSRSQRCWIIVN